MNNLDDLERTILSDARAFIEPTAADEARIFDRLVLGLGGAATVSAIAAARNGAFTRLQRWLVTRKGVALSCALLGAGAGFGAGFVVGQNHRRANDAFPAQVAENRSGVAPDVAAKPSPEELNATTVRAPDVSAAAPSAATSTALNSASGAAAALNSASAAAAALSSASGSPVPRRAQGTESDGNRLPPATSDPIGEELALLKRAERAIRAQNSLLALGLLRELDQRFPRGTLLDERAAARVMAEGQQQAPELARRTGEAYLRRATSGVYHERVRRLCGISDSTSNPKSVSSDKDSIPLETYPDSRRSR